MIDTCYDVSRVKFFLYVKKKCLRVSNVFLNKKNI